MKQQNEVSDGREPVPDLPVETNVDPIPDFFKGVDRWACWGYSKLRGSGDYAKKPVGPWFKGHAYPAKGIKENLTSIEEASKYIGLKEHDYRNHIGIPEDAVPKLGLFFRLWEEPEETEIVFIDLDDVRDPTTGALHPTATELIEKAGSYGQFSTSGTGLHLFLRGRLPDDITAIEDELPHDDKFPKAEIEVYDSARFIAMTGDHIEGTPLEVNENDRFIEELVDEYGDPEPSSVHDVDIGYTEPEVSREEIRSVEKTEYAKDVYDAIRHTKPQDISLRSPVTEDRGDSLSLDPSWEKSESGTRLAQLEDGWVYRKGMVGLDPVQIVALEEGIINSVNDYPSGEDFWEKALPELRKRGAKIPEYDPTSRYFSSAAILPDVGCGPGESAISTDDLRENVYQAIRGSIMDDENVCIDAIMSGGKTYGTFKAAADLDEQVTYFAPRLELYDQAAEYAKENGIPEEEIKVLPSIKRDCPTWNGEHGAEWEHRVKRQYYSGARPKAIHEMNDDIPCRGHDHDSDEDDPSPCPYEAMWDFDPDDFQVIIGHYKHAHVTHITIGRTVVFDEDAASAFTSRIEGETLVGSINTFLDMDVSPPVDGFDDLLQARHNPKRVKEIERWFNQMEQADEFDFSSPDSKNVIQLAEHQTYHGYAPHAVYAIATSEPIDDDSAFERAFIPSGMSGALFFTTSDEHGEYYVEFRESPELHYATSIIALDGTPLVDESRNDPHRLREWSQSLGVPMEHRRILSDDERRAYISNTLGHTYVQVSESVNPYSSGRYNSMDEDAALCAAVREMYGSTPLVFTPKKVADQYLDAGFKEKGLAKEIDYPGNLRGTDRYGDERLLVHLGSTHHGDHELRRRAAWLRETVDVSGKGMDRDYGSDIGNAILRQMRENQTAQNVMRVGRDGGGAIIVLKTGAIPDYFEIAAEGGVTPWPDGMKEVLEAWNALSPGPLKTVTVGELSGHDAVSVSERQVRNALDAFCDLGYVKKGDHPDDGRKNVYVDDGLGDVDPDEEAEVELPDVEWPDAEEGGDVEVRRTNVYTSDFERSEQFVTEPDQKRLHEHDMVSDGGEKVGDPPGE